MPTSSVSGDLQVSGTLRAGTYQNISRTAISQDDYATFALPLTGFRVWDAFQTQLAAAGSDDLGITAGAWATGAPYITTGDVKAAGLITRYARTMFTLPPEYVAGESIRLRFAAGMLTTISDTSATLDAEVYKSDRDGTVGGGDLVGAAAQDIRSLAFAEKTFEISPVGLEPGDTLDIRIAIATNDAATATAVIAAIAHAEIQLDIQG